MYSGLCPDTYPDEKCRGNYPIHYYDPPLLYNLNSDPSEVYQLQVDDYADVMETIIKVQKSVFG